MTSVTIEFFDLVNCADWFNWQQLPKKGSQKGRERERVGHRRVAWLSGRTEANPESPFTASFSFFFVRPEGLSESAVNYLPSYYDFDNHKANKRKGLEKRGGVGVVEVLHVCPLMELLGFLFRGELSSRNILQHFYIQNVCRSIKLERCSGMRKPKAPL